MMPLDRNNRVHLFSINCYRQVLPHQEGITKRPTDRQFELLLNDSRPIFLVFHGVGSNRAVDDRSMRQKLLSSMGYHTLALDYRGKFVYIMYNISPRLGFGDSEGTPVQQIGPISDAITVFKYVRRLAPNRHVFLYGHSLGTG